MKRALILIAFSVLVATGLQSCSASGAGMYKNKDCFGQKPNNHKYQ